MGSIVAVVVLYKQTSSESIAIQTLLQAMRGREHCLRFIIYDNSPAPQDGLGDRDIIGGINVSYFHDASNPGLAAAYACALESAVCDRSPWLMLLDQDTEVTTQYLSEAIQLASCMDAEVCAITPRLIVGGEQRSPHLHSAQGEDKLISGETIPSGRNDRRLGAWNSGAIVRVDSVIAIGGIPPEFPLDNLDYAMFHLLQKGRQRVFVMDSQLKHQLSVADLHSLSMARLRGKLRADILLQRRLLHRTRLSLAVEFLRTGISLLGKLPDKRMGLLCLRFSLSSLISRK